MPGRNACLESNVGNSSSENVVAQGELRGSEGEAEARFKENGKNKMKGMR